MVSTKAPRDQTINVRATRQQQQLIDRAAQASGKSRSEFILEAASMEAEHVLLDQTLFLLDDSAYESFSALLDNPPPPSESLRRLMQTPAPWE